MATAGPSVSKMSEECFDFICTSCDEENKTVEAVRYCVECSGYCCQPCTDMHKKFPTLRNHNLLDVSQGKQAGNQQPKLPEFPTERCGTHHGKVLDMFCEKHNVVGCSTCISKDHRSCPDSQIYSIPEMIDALFNLSNSKQTQSLLKDLMNSMSSISDSKDDQLTTLIKAMNEALKKITTFQKALETAVKKAAEMSKKELEDAYKKLEEEILHDKAEVQKTKDALQNTSAKLQKAELNRAQRFVCTKLAETQIKEADDQMSKRKLKDITDVHLSFKPNQSLRDYINGLHGIGEVVRRTKKRTDLYKVKGSKDINIKLTNDSTMCYSLGCCLTLDNHQLLLTDFKNQKLKRLDIKNMTVIDYLKLEGNPIGVCCIGTLEAVVACGSSNMIQFVSIDKKMSLTRQIKMSHHCQGIATKDDKLYITDNGSSLYMYDVTGNLLKTTSLHNAEKTLLKYSRHITFNESGKKMCIGSWNNDVVCFDDAGNFLSAYKDNDLSGTDGVCVDGRGNIFVVGKISHNVLQFNEDGKNIGVVLKQQDGLNHPRSVCFHQKLNVLFVSMDDSEVLKMYELE
ncbi:hypothetical protein ACF0H5_017865 [Mactra antiquata]